MKKMMEKYTEEIKEAWNELKNKKTRKKQIPNMLTATRLFAPFVIIPSVVTGNFIFAGISTLLFSATDMADGYLARKMKTTSALGRDLDAIADKVFVGTLMVTLLLTNVAYSIPLVLEGAIATVNIYKKINDKNPGSHMIGKIKMASLYTLLALGFVNMYIPVPSLGIRSLYIATTILQTLTICDYCKKDNKIKKTEMEIKKIFTQDESLLEDNVQKEKTPQQLRIEKYQWYKKYLEEQKRLEELNYIDNNSISKVKVKK